MNQKTERKSPEHPNNITAELPNKLMLRTITFFPLNLSALTLSESTEDILKSVTGARRQRPHQSSGNGTTQARSGIDGTITSGTTGDHPREDSLQLDGPGIRDSGITTVMSSSTLEDTGTDSRATNGSDMELPFQSSQRPQEEPRFVDLSTCSRNGDSHPLLDPRHFQDVELDQERAQFTTCGKTERIADSLEVDSLTKSTPLVRLASHISGLELSDASRVQSLPIRD